jgi:ubiquinone/menaquinone biosynthesis C-methylase UbiE
MLTVLAAGGRDMAQGSAFQFTDSKVPKAYDEILVPRMFEPWARRLLDEAGLRSGEAVLDVATGPGTVARLAAQRVGPRGRVVATDISQPMLDVARRKPALPDSAPITYVESPAAPLPVEDAAFDVVLCQQGLQFFPDRLAALLEMRRALKPGGRAAIAVWADIKANVIYNALHGALRETVPSDVADRLLAPFSWPDPEVLKETIAAAGFRNVRVRTIAAPLIFEQGTAQAITTLSGSPLAPALAALPAAIRDKLHAAATARLQPLLSGGKVVGDLTANLAVAQA